MFSKLFDMDLLFAQTAILFVTLVITVIFTIYNLKLSDKNRIFENITNLFRLKDERDRLLYKLKSGQLNDASNNEDINLLSNIQLQMKHILFDIEGRLSSNMNASQYRLLADCCEELLYVGKAMKYWEKTFNCKFPDASIKCEYHRHYGEFLYRRGLITEGDLSYQKALSYEGEVDSRLLSRLDELRYIHFQTCESWVSSINNTIQMRFQDTPSKDKKEIIKIKDIMYRMFVLANGIKDFNMKRT